MHWYSRQTSSPGIEKCAPWQGFVYHQAVGFVATFHRSPPQEQRREAREVARTNGSACQNAGLARKVARLRPIGVIKG